MRFLGPSGDAAGRLLSFGSVSGAAVISPARIVRASLSKSAAGKDRNILPKRPSRVEDREVELSPRTPPPCAFGGRVLSFLTVSLMFPPNPTRQNLPASCRRSLCPLGGNNFA